MKGCSSSAPGRVLPALESGWRVREKNTALASGKSGKPRRFSQAQQPKTWRCKASGIANKLYNLTQ